MSGDIDKVETLPAETDHIDSSIELQALPAKTNKYRVYPTHLRCEHDYDGLQRTVEFSSKKQPFQVVPNCEDGTETVRIIHRGPLETGRKSLEASGNGIDLIEDGKVQRTLTILEKRAESGERVFKVPVVAPKPSGYEFWTKEFWSLLNEPNKVAVQGLPGGKAEIEVYPCDQYELEISFPPLDTLSVGHKFENEARVSYQSEENQKKLGVEYKKTHTYEAEMTEWSPLKGSVTSVGLVEKDSMKMSANLRSDGSISGSVQREEGGVVAAGQQQARLSDVIDSVVLRKNGDALVVNPAGTVNGMLQLASAIYEVIHAIRDVPKFGWYCDFNVQVFQGALAAKWGWVENRDHRVFLRYALQLKLMLLEVKIEIGVGVSSFSFALQIFARIAGKVELSAEGMKESADGNITLEFGFAPTIEGIVGARVKLGPALHVQATMITGIEIGSGKVHISAVDGNRVEASITWTGLRGVVAGSSQMRTRAATKLSSPNQLGVGKTLIPEKKLAEWRMPQPETYESSYVDREELEQIIAKVFRSDLQDVEKPGEHFFSDEKVTPDDLAREVADVVMRRDDLRRDAKSMEGLAFDVKNRLNEKAHGWFRLFTGGHVDYDDFESFIRSESMKSVLDEYVDTFEVARKKIQNKEPKACHLS